MKILTKDNFRYIVIPMKEKKTKKLLIWIEPSKYELLEYYASIEHRNVSEVIRMLVNEYLVKNTAEEAKGDIKNNIDKLKKVSTSNDLKVIKESLNKLNGLIELIEGSIE